MPIEAKPLFRPEVIRSHLAGVFLSAATRDVVAKWAKLIGSGQADQRNERKLLPEFLTDIGRGVLGYTRVVDSGERWTISQEKHIPVDGKFANMRKNAFLRLCCTNPTIMPLAVRLLR